MVYATPLTNPVEDGAGRRATGVIGCWIARAGRFESVPALDQELVKTIPWMESRLGEPLPSVPSPRLVPTESAAPISEAEDPLAIPEFLRRPFPRRFLHCACQEETPANQNSRH